MSPIQHRRRATIGRGPNRVSIRPSGRFCANDELRLELAIRRCTCRSSGCGTSGSCSPSPSAAATAPWRAGHPRSGDRRRLRIRLRPRPRHARYENRFALPGRWLRAHGAARQRHAGDVLLLSWRGRRDAPRSNPLGTSRRKAREGHSLDHMGKRWCNEGKATDDSSPEGSLCVTSANWFNLGVASGRLSSC